MNRRNFCKKSLGGLIVLSLTGGKRRVLWNKLGLLTEQEKQELIVKYLKTSWGQRKLAIAMKNLTPKI